MQTTTATLHAGLLARKGEARPSAPACGPVLTPLDLAAASHSGMTRRDPVATSGLYADRPSRCIELPRCESSPRAPGNTARLRRQVHARVDNALHLRLRIAAIRSGRTQQGLVASALEAYLSFLDEDVYSPPCGATNAWV